MSEVSDENINEAQIHTNKKISNLPNEMQRKVTFKFFKTPYHIEKKSYL